MVRCEIRHSSTVTLLLLQWCAGASLLLLCHSFCLMRLSQGVLRCKELARDFTVDNWLPGLYLSHHCGEHCQIWGCPLHFPRAK